VTSKSGSPLHFGERRPNSTEVVELQRGEGGLMAYRELSGIAHANPTALIRRAQEVPEADRPEGVTTAIEGVSIAKPAPDPASLVPMIGTAIQAYLDALDIKLTMFGWNRPAWHFMRRDIGKKLVALLGDVQPPASLEAPPRD
jgi:hypothetical protein